MNNDIELLGVWLDYRGIPREEKEVPWEEAKPLPLSQRVLRLWRATCSHEYQKAAGMADLLRRQEVFSARRQAILQCANTLMLDSPEQAYKLVAQMGIEHSDFDAYLHELNTQDVVEEHAHETLSR